MWSETIPLCSRQDEAYVYILLLTSRQSSEDVVSGLEAGADDSLTKLVILRSCGRGCTPGVAYWSLKTSWWKLAKMRYKADHDALTIL